MFLNRLCFFLWENHLCYVFGVFDQFFWALCLYFWFLTWKHSVSDKAVFLCVCLLSEILSNGAAQVSGFILYALAPTTVIITYISFCFISFQPSPWESKLPTVQDAESISQVPEVLRRLWLHLDEYILPLDGWGPSHCVSQNCYACKAFIYPLKGFTRKGSHLVWHAFMSFCQRIRL